MLFFVAEEAGAQQIPTSVDDPVATAPVRLGPLALAPRVSVSNLGVDTNVFNTVQNPQHDFTFTIAPGTEAWLRTGRGLLSMNGGVQLIYFNQFESERAFNHDASGQYEFRFNRIRPFTSIRTVNAKQRPGYEIDARARHYETELKAGLDFRLMSKSIFRVEARRLNYSFAGDAVFDGRPLNQALNRTLRGVNVSWRHRLTALTNWVSTASQEQERFEFETARNSDSFRFSTGFELGRFALIRGTAFVGYRRFASPVAATLPEFSGVTADVNVSYTAPTQTRLAAIVARDKEQHKEQQQARERISSS